MAHTEITIGAGLVDIGHIVGDRPGLIIHPRKSPEGGPEMKAGKGYTPVDGDVVVWIADPGHADVLLQQLAPYRKTAAITDAMLEAMARAHDAEDAAKMGEPSPWREDLIEQFSAESGEGAFEEWRQERIAAMRCAMEALAKLLPAPHDHTTPPTVLRSFQPAPEPAA